MTHNPNIPLLDHIHELRGRLIKSVVVTLVTSVIIYNFIDQIMIFITKPVGKLVFTSPADAFIARLTLTVLGGVIAALPYILYQIWSFVALALKQHEKKYIILYGPFSLLFFVGGILFAHFIAVPISIHFLLGFSSQWLQPMITIKSYISFFCTMVLAFGVIFELPIIIIFLTSIGIATPAFLTQKRKHAIVIILIVSAIITPPDVITLLIMTGPLLILYEFGVLAAKITYRKKYSLES